MTIHVKLFAQLRDHAGVSEVTLTLDKGASVEDAFRVLNAQVSGLNHVIKPGAIAVALNRAYTSRDAILHDGDELALIPPVSGG